ncbi:hypothetical protein KHC28_14955 [Ancylobacter sonchi]|uniref:hypothetical protein n=1 Tax=Ancylobacter sonchi TaxID=1937790 RepID=UPI001BD4B6DB|nr:hypothetical protein [Ancylobacter sonchi]MBS7534952.1 hypothetical protein [Ancylobacter sonchi]
MHVAGSTLLRRLKMLRRLDAFDFFGSTKVPTSFMATDIARHDGRALDIAALTPSRIDGAVLQQPCAHYNLVTAAGQSFHHGEAAGAALSVTQPYDNKMVGQSIHNGTTRYGSDAWKPIGDTFALQPLVAANVRGGAVYSNAQVAANLGTWPAYKYLGEAGVVAAANAWRGRYLARRSLATDPDHLFVSNGVGRGGTSITALIPGGAVWGRFTSYCAQMKALADREGKTVGMSAYLWDQGQADSSGHMTKAAYKEHLATLRSGVNEVVASTFRQPNPPAFLLSQMAGVYTTNDLAISQAQLEFARETPGVYLIGPDYQYTDAISGGHLRANGYRNQGLQYGKVLYRLFELGQNWRPLEPLAIYGRGKEVLVTLHVPAPPIVFDLPYRGAAQVADQADKGFLVTDAAGANPVLSVAIVGRATLRLVLARDVVGGASLWHGRNDISAGHGFVRDSDAMPASDAYEYIADSGMPAEDNIPALVGKPYSLANWLCGFVEPIMLV